MASESRGGESTVRFSPRVLRETPRYTYLVAAVAALAIIFVWRFVPETKGRPLEHIDRYWTHDRQWPAATDPT